MSQGESAIAEQVKLNWKFENGTWTLSDRETFLGFVRVTEEGKFQAKYRDKWLSASEWTPLVHFDEFDEAKRALLKAFLEGRNAHR